MHIYLWEIYPPTSKLSIDALHTATPNLADFMADLLADVNPLNQA